MNKQGEYVSMFKIDGVPILPPLMTEAKRREMVGYKQMAIALEKKLNLVKQQSAAIQEAESDATIDNDYLKISNLFNNPLEKKAYKKCPKKYPPVVKSTSKLQKSDTFIYDIKCNTVIIPYEETGKCLNEDNNNLVCSIEEQEKSYVIKNSVENDNFMSLSLVHDKQISSPKIAKQLTPEIAVKPPTPDTANINTNEYAELHRPDSLSSSYSRQSGEQELEVSRNEISPKRASTSHLHKNPPRCMADQPIVRSNSFTLDTPSPVLLKHLIKIHPKTRSLTDQLQSKSSSQTPKKLKSNRVQREKAGNEVLKKSPSKPPTQHPLQKRSTILITNSSMFKNKKSPYDIKINSKTKIFRKHKSPLKKMSTINIKQKTFSSPALHKSQPKVKDHEVNDFESMQKKFLDIEQEHRQKMMELISKQQEEQKLMQEAFERQQKILLEEFNAGLFLLQIPQISPKSPQSTSSKDVISALSEKSDEHTIVQVQEKEKPAKTAEKVQPNSPSNAKENPTKSPKCSRRLFNATPPPPPHSATHVISPAKRRSDAATKINAFARGYLVRRLFHTEHVQNIIQTIRDTLIFVLEFHKETQNDRSEENIMLKARLLQQLTSACNYLHGIFFDLSTKARMEIIAKDRAYINAKGKGRKIRKSRSSILSPV